METILITGGTGLIGKALQEKLLSRGYFVTILSRRKSENPNSYFWNIDEEKIEIEAIKTADFIIHLAGAGIADKRWSRSRKRELVNSRVLSTKLLLKKVKELNPKLKGFIAASGIGYYGAITSDKIFTENDKPGNDFLANICKLWEIESLKFQNENIRTVIFRTGIVLSEKSGALEKMVSTITKGFGAVLGKGNQYMPWIHIEDLCELYIQAIENKKFNKIYNTVTPEHVTNKELTHKIANQLDKNIWLPPIPSIVLKIIFGRMSILLLKGSRVSCTKIQNLGFKFKYSSIKSALKDLLTNV